MNSLKVIILVVFGSIFFNASKAATIKGCLSNFIQGASSGNTEAGANFNNCVSSIPGGSGGTNQGGPDLEKNDAVEEIPDIEIPNFSFPELLNYVGISSMSTVSEQIIAFENYGAPALDVIRNVNVSGLDEETALSYLVSYVISNNLMNTFYNFANFTGYPGLQYNILINYAKTGNNDLPLSWLALGYSLN